MISMDTYYKGARCIIIGSDFPMTLAEKRILEVNATSGALSVLLPPLDFYGGPFGRDVVVLLNTGANFFNVREPDATLIGILAAGSRARIHFDGTYRMVVKASTITVGT